MAFSTAYLVLLGFLLMWSMPSKGKPIRGNWTPVIMGAIINKQKKIQWFNKFTFPGVDEEIREIHWVIIFWSIRREMRFEQHILDTRSYLLTSNVMVPLFLRLQTSTAQRRKSNFTAYTNQDLTLSNSFSATSNKDWTLSAIFDRFSPYAQAQDSAVKS